jgi:protein-disulfide isomerase-like protein with CxxC motif
MSAELFFIYDSHCPWSYATTPLVNAVNQSLPEIAINLWHCGYFSDADGNSVITKQQLIQVKELSTATFSPAYTSKLSEAKDSTLCANLMTWASNKTPEQALKLLNQLQAAHFGAGNDLNNQDDVANIVSELKLSPPAKVFNKAKLSNDAEAQIHEIYALQEIMGTQAIPALLLAVNDELILLDHSLYLLNPDAIVEAITLELNKHS